MMPSGRGDSSASRSRRWCAGSRLIATSGVGAVLKLVIIAWSSRSPALLVVVPDIDGNAVHGQEDCQQQDAGRGGQDVKLGLGPRRPVEDLDRHGGIAAEQAVRVIADEDQGAEQQ